VGFVRRNEPFGTGWWEFLQSPTFDDLAKRAPTECPLSQPSNLEFTVATANASQPDEGLSQGLRTKRAIQLDDDPARMAALCVRAALDKQWFDCAFRVRDSRITATINLAKTPRPQPGLVLSEPPASAEIIPSFNTLEPQPDQPSRNKSVRFGWVLIPSHLIAFVLGGLLLGRAIWRTAVSPDSVQQQLPERMPASPKTVGTPLEPVQPKLNGNSGSNLDRPPQANIKHSTHVDDKNDDDEPD
jgi:hypothetical protein